MQTSEVKNILQFGTRQIAYLLHRSNRKQLRIVVSPELTVDVYAPIDADRDQINIIMHKKAAWIVQKLDKLEAYHPLPTPTNYLSGETIVYLGRQYRLKIENGPPQTAKLLGRFLWVWVKDKTDIKMIKRAIDIWYRKRAHEVFGRKLKKCMEIASRHGVPQPLITIRSMQKRWGSCSSSGRITLNVRLAQAPVHCIEYVIMHELCHLHHHNHARSFYSLLTRCMPDWLKRKEALESVKFV